MGRLQGELKSVQAMLYALRRLRDIAIRLSLRCHHVRRSITVH
jgi:hypothetical protein